VLDGIAAGTVWCNMVRLSVDVYISAPQKGWSGPACAGLVMMSERARNMLDDTSSAAFSVNLAQWTNVMEMYENKDGAGPGFRYYTTLPTDALMTFNEQIKENEKVGLPQLQKASEELGTRIRKVLADRGFKSTAADGFAAPGVVVVYSPIPGMVGKMKQQGLQLAGGVPWKLDEEQYGGLNPKACTFRVGLFGLDKLVNIDRTVNTFTEALDRVVASEPRSAL
jgi:alanine-glyoxylate transaminase/serine-glyoxylate transaminase/serine-pyruvate transaminase